MNFNRIKGLIKKIFPSFLISWYHFLLAFVSAAIYRFPSKKLKVIGVTGTNGKSTVVSMTSSILEEAGYKIASSSSMKFKVAKKEWENTLRMTMPGRFALQKLLRQAVDAGCQYAVLEITSEGIKQHRHRFIDFNAAVFTNLTPEHIESHKGFEKYREAKGKLFQSTKGIHVLNLEDGHTDYFLKFPADEKYGYGIDPKVQEGLTIVKAENCQISDKGSTFHINNIEFRLNLLGKFNIHNTLAAVCVGLSQGIDLETCRKGLEKIKEIQGRMEMVVSEPFKVLIDYAFTPNALEKVYQTIRDNFNPKKVICVLGSCGGGRDKWKRPVLGRIAGDYCDEIIVTNEDPYDEDPMDIINQVAEGAGPRARKTLNRRKAIRESLESAEAGDVVIITGKGSEPCICVQGGKKIPWNEKQVVKEEFNESNL